MSREMSAPVLEEPGPPRAPETSDVADIRLLVADQESEGQASQDANFAAAPAAIGLGLRPPTHAPARSQGVDVRGVHLHERLQQRRVRDVRRVENERRSRSASLTGASLGGPFGQSGSHAGAPSADSVAADEPTPPEHVASTHDALREARDENERLRRSRSARRVHLHLLRHRTARATARGSSTTRATPSAERAEDQAARRVREPNPDAGRAVITRRRRRRRVNQARASNFASSTSRDKLGCDLELLPRRVCGCGSEIDEALSRARPRAPWQARVDGNEFEVEPPSKNYAVPVPACRWQGQGDEPLGEFNKAHTVTHLKGGMPGRSQCKACSLHAAQRRYMLRHRDGAQSAPNRRWRLQHAVCSEAPRTKVLLVRRPRHGRAAQHGQVA